jgi:hypothetical protein
LAEISIPKLTLEQVQELSEKAELSARKYVLSQVPTSRIIDLDVFVDAQGTKPITVVVDVNVVLSPIMKDFDVEELTKEATNQAFIAVEQYLRELKCKSQK